MNIIERLVGPLPIGDVAAMRRLATELRTRANDVRHHGDVTGAQPGAMSFAGPAADAFRQFAEHERTLLRAIADEINGQARALENEATETANAQRTWHRRADRLTAEVNRLERTGKHAWDHLDDLRRAIF